MAIVADQDRVNMVPLIDCMFFLILFFLVATRFTPDEFAIASLLPTDQGPGGGHREQLALGVTIAIVPADLPRGLQPSDYARLVTAQRRDGTFARRVAVRVGGSAPLLLDGAALNGRSAEPATVAELARLHAYLRQELAQRELPDLARAQQPAVTVAAFSGLPWSFPLAAFDGVRAYERDRSPTALADAAALGDAREVTFRPAPIRNVPGGTVGDELYELVHLR